MQKEKEIKNNQKRGINSFLQQLIQTKPKHNQRIWRQKVYCIMHFSMVSLMGKTLSNLTFRSDGCINSVQRPQVRSWCYLQNCKVRGERDLYLQENTVHTGFISSEIPCNFMACIQKLRKQKFSGDLTSIPTNSFFLWYFASNPVSQRELQLAVQLLLRQ